MPHVPLHVSDKFQGKSGRGLYGDVIMEIDWSVGQILGVLKKHGLDERTLVVFTSDNGPWLLYGDHAGSAGPLREGKATAFEGGVRVPALMRWPGKIPRGKVCDELSATIDLLPTFAKLAGAELPKDRTLDGKDIWPLMSRKWGRRLRTKLTFIIGASTCRRFAAANGNCIFRTPILDRPRPEARPNRENTRTNRSAWSCSI
jgi:arylsulfatase A-like enzyme